MFTDRSPGGHRREINEIAAPGQILGTCQPCEFDQAFAAVGLNQFLLCGEEVAALKGDSAHCPRTRRRVVRGHVSIRFVEARQTAAPRIYYCLWLIHSEQSRAQRLVAPD